MSTGIRDACGRSLDATAEAQREADARDQDCPRCWRWFLAARRRAEHALFTNGDIGPIMEFTRKSGIFLDQKMLERYPEIARSRYLTDRAARN